MRMFTFDPARYAEEFARRGYVHIPGGLTEEFLQSLNASLRENRRQKEQLKRFAMTESHYELPSPAHYDELLGCIGQIVGVEPKALILSERHFKTYDPDANPNPPAHKDRHASAISVGLSIDVAPGSTLVLYPDEHLETNPFNSSRELSESYSPDRSQNVFLKGARKVEIQDHPGDVVIFRGNKIWHLRSRPAGTAMLYLKLNGADCDPLGEDPTTPLRRQMTEEFLRRDDERLARLVPHVGRRVDYFHRRMSREWQECNGVVLYGERHFTIDDDEMNGLRAMDGRRNVHEVAQIMGGGSGAYAKIRRLAARGVIDLVEEASNG